MHGQNPIIKSRFALVAIFVLFVSVAPTGAQSIPERISDDQFWKLSTDMSEPDGTFRSDNLLSNEIFFQYVIPDLLKTAKSERAYLGVGPEQNFTYMAALKPKIAIIVDIRRGNLDLHLMYKAIFELSKDRADFVSMLFSKKRPEGLTAQSSAREIFTAFANVESSEALYKENLQTIDEHLKSKHKFALLDLDLRGIEYVYRNFYQFGPAINYNSSSGGFGGGMGRVSYADLMTATDEQGESRSYLANDANFRFLKDLESKNLVVPVVGDFGGLTAIRAIGRYLKENNGTVTAFYLSNVEEYLYQGRKWEAFCRSVSTLPLDSSSTFIRSESGFAGGFASSLAPILGDIKGCVAR